MWKSQLGVSKQQSKADDDWDTDPDYVNNVTEKDQRWGAKHIAGSGHHESVDLKQLREEVRQDDSQIKKKVLEDQNAGYGYGGKYGVEKDRMDKSAVGADYHAPKEKHTSQTDYQKGFGGKFGVDDRVDKSAVGWDYKANVEKHQSQKDYKGGFGGEFGVQSDRQDKSAVGWDYREKSEKHQSQKDYKTGFGGEFGVQKNAQDQSAVGWDYQDKSKKHSSQTDYSSGFGGKHGVQNVVDKSAVGWDYKADKESHASQKDYKAGFGGEFGVQKDRQDDSAVGWDHHEKTAAHESQKDYKAGFGGQFGVQSDRQDKSAHGWDDTREKPPVERKKVDIESSGVKAGSLKAKFEAMTMDGAQDTQKKLEEERARRKAAEERERESARQAEEERQKLIAEEHRRLDEEEERNPKPKDDEKEEEEKAERKPSQQAFRYDAAPVAAKRQADQIPQEPAPSTVVRENEMQNGKNHHAEALQGDEHSMQTDKPFPQEVEEDAGNGNYTSDVKAVALFDYQAGDDDELSFEPNDIITNVEFVDDGWWRGECRGNTGLFPANYVEVQK